MPDASSNSIRSLMHEVWLERLSRLVKNVTSELVDLPSCARFGTPMSQSTRWSARASEKQKSPRTEQAPWARRGRTLTDSQCRRPRFRRCELFWNGSLSTRNHRQIRELRLARWTTSGRCNRILPVGGPFFGPCLASSVLRRIAAHADDRLRVCHVKAETRLSLYPLTCAAGHHSTGWRPHGHNLSNTFTKNGHQALPSASLLVRAAAVRLCLPGCRARLLEVDRACACGCAQRRPNRF